MREGKGALEPVEPYASYATALDYMYVLPRVAVHNDGM